MSRIGRAPITVPAGVEISIDENNVVTVKGPKGTLTQKFQESMTITQEAGQLQVTRPDDLREHRSLHGLTRALINNMVIGVTQGFTKKLEINGVGYRAALEGGKLTMTLGYSHPVVMEAPEGITLEVPANNQIVVSGIDKQQVGQFAADIRAKRPPEPYKGKGIKYSDEVIRHKVGKTGVKK